MVGRAMAGRNRRRPLRCGAADRGFLRIAPVTVHLYSLRMADEHAPTTLDVELKRLEKRLEELVATVHRLKDENRALRQRQDSLVAEKTSIMNRNEQVRARVEAMIGRLRAMERSA